MNIFFIINTFQTVFRDYVQIFKKFQRVFCNSMPQITLTSFQSDDTPDPNHCEECSSSFTPQTLYHKYMLRNDTSVPLLLKQEGSKQEILIQPLSATLYAWYHAKRFPQRLFVTIQEGNWRSEKGNKFYLKPKLELTAGSHWMSSMAFCSSAPLDSEKSVISPQYLWYYCFI